jgi:tetratricopeptide (TPR) repeat protein
MGSARSPSADAGISSRHASCESKRDNRLSHLCLALEYDKLGRRADAEAELDNIQASEGEASAYQYADIYAQWGNRTQALDWLDTAMRLRDPDLVELKTDPLFDPLRQEPRFQAVMRQCGSILLGGRRRRPLRS